MESNVQTSILLICKNTGLSNIDEIFCHYFEPIHLLKAHFHQFVDNYVIDQIRKISRRTLLLVILMYKLHINS